MLVSYRGQVRSGRIELEMPVLLPEGAEVVVVVTISDSERRQAFAEFEQVLAECPADEDITTVSDEELVDLVHQVRETRTTA